MNLTTIRNNVQFLAIHIVLLSARVRCLEPQFLQQYQIAGIMLKSVDTFVLTIQINKILIWHYLLISKSVIHVAYTHRRFRSLNPV